MLVVSMTAPLLAADNLTCRFDLREGVWGKKQSLTAVQDVSLPIAAGSAIGIAGESGCGKSTLAKLLCGLIAPSAGSVAYNGVPLTELDQKGYQDFRRSVQMVFQDPFSSLNPRFRIQETVGEPLRIHRMGTRQEQSAETARLLSIVGLSPECGERYPHEFSGGQRQRIGIARALAVQPKLLIADEPVSALDLSVQAQIINLLQDLRNDFSLSLLLISHDLAVIRHLCDTICVMYLGRIVEYASATAIDTCCLHPYTAALISAIPRITGKPADPSNRISSDLPSPLHQPAGCPFHPRCPFCRDLCRTKLPPLEEKESGHLAACHYSEDIRQSVSPLLPSSQEPDGNYPVSEQID